MTEYTIITRPYRVLYKPIDDGMFEDVTFLETLVEEGNQNIFACKIKGPYNIYIFIFDANAGGIFINGSKDNIKWANNNFQIYWPIRTRSVILKAIEKFNTNPTQKHIRIILNNV